MYCCSVGCQKHAECNLLVRALCVLGSLNVFLTGPLLASSIEDHFPMQWGLHPSPPPQPFRMLSSPSLPPFLLPLSQTPTLYLPLNCPLLVLLPLPHTHYLPLPPPLLLLSSPSCRHLSCSQCWLHPAGSPMWLDLRSGTAGERDELCQLSRLVRCMAIL